MTTTAKSRSNDSTRPAISFRSAANSSPLSPPTLFLAEAASACVEARNQTHRTGHGLMAERVNFLRDLERGSSASHEGWSNSRYGPDKIVDGHFVQCKYYASARAGIRSCFDADGKFLYAEGTIIELPNEQVAEGIQLFAEKLAISTEEASTLIRGGIPYEESLALCRPLTRASLSYDIKMAEVTFWSAFVTGSLTTGLRCAIHGETDLLRKTCHAGFTSALQAGAVHVLAGQLGRSGLEASLTPLTGRAAAKFGTRTNRLIGLAAGKKPGVGQTSKLINGQIIANLAATTIQSIPDVYRLGTGEMGAAEAFSRLAGRTRNIAVQQLGGKIGSALGTLTGAAMTGGSGAKVGGIAGRVAGEIFFPTLVAFLGDLAFGLPKEKEEAIRKVLAEVALEVAVQREMTEDAFQRYLGFLAESSSELVKLYRSDDEDFCKGLFRTYCDVLATPFVR